MAPGWGGGQTHTCRNAATAHNVFLTKTYFPTPFSDIRFHHRKKSQRREKKTHHHFLKTQAQPPACHEAESAPKQDTCLRR